MEQTQNNAEALLRLEEPFSPKDVKWLVAATSRDGTKGRVTPYADPLAYTDRLNEVVTASGWTAVCSPHHLACHQAEERQDHPNGQGAGDLHRDHRRSGKPQRQW